MANIVIGEVDSGYAKSSCLYLWLERVQPTAASIAGNYTDITWEAGVWIGGNNEWYSNAIKVYSVYINGTKVWAGGTFSNISGNGYHKFANSTLRIYHNDNGSKSFSASISGWFYSYGDKSGSKNFSLPTIPRVSDLSVDKTSVPADNTTTVIATATKKADAFNDVLTVSLGERVLEIESDVAFKIPDEWINGISSTSAVAKVKVETFSGTTSIGSKTVDLTITVPEDVKPVINAINISEAVEAVTNAFGNRYVQSRSQLNVSVDVTEAYSSGIGEYITTIENVSYNSQEFKSNILQSSGTLEITAKVTDGRGRTDEKTVTINVVEYVLPVITAMPYVQGNMIDGVFVQNSNGNCTKVTISGRVSSVEGQNTKTLKLYYKKTTDEKPTERLVNLSDWDFTVDVIINNTDPTVTYEYIAELTDKINVDKPERYPITTGVVVLSRLAGGKGITLFEEATAEGFVVGGGKPTSLNDLTVQGVANIATDEELQTVWESTFGSAISALTSIKDRLKDIAYKLGLIADYVVEADTSGIWTYRKWASGIAECWGRYPTGSININAAWGGVYYQSVSKINFPFAFIESPIANMFVENGNAWVIAYPPTTVATDATYLVSPAATTITTNIAIQVKGRWK